MLLLADFSLNQYEFEFSKFLFFQLIFQNSIQSISIINPHVNRKEILTVESTTTAIGIATIITTT